MTNHHDAAGFPFEDCWYGCVDHFPAGYPDDYMEQGMTRNYDTEDKIFAEAKRGESVYVQSLGKQIAHNAMQRANMPVMEAFSRKEDYEAAREHFAAQQVTLGLWTESKRQEFLERNLWGEPMKFGTAMAQAWTTKDSGARTTFETGMQRDVTTGKPRWDLVSPAGLPLGVTMGYRHAMLMARGAEKYGDRNWEKARTDGEYARFKQSAYRHFMQWYHGEDDEDHAAAVYFNIAGAEFVQYMQKGES
jgi:hypothetical protein